jgi:DNA invertase Pin-like site-specific DNA recombinase
MPAPTTPKYVSYLRVSSKGQINGDGFERQRIAIQKRMGAEPMAEFAEEGISGTTDSLARPALSRLLQYLLEEDTSTKVVVIERADRLARDLVVSELLIRQFAEMGITVIEAEGGNDLTAGSDNPTAKLIRQILAALSEWEKTSIVNKLRAARNRTRAANGRCEGRKPYGSHEHEQPVVKEMVKLSRAGLTTREIAAAMNADGVRTRMGGEWRHGTVAAVLQREAVCQ